MKLMGRVWIRGAALATFALSMSILSFADEIKIPFGVYIDAFKTECKSKGLDLYGTQKSNGFVTDEASNFSVFTYHTATPEQMEIVKEATWKNIRK